MVSPILPGVRRATFGELPTANPHPGVVLGVRRAAAILPHPAQILQLIPPDVFSPFRLKNWANQADFEDASAATARPVRPDRTQPDFHENA